MTFTPTNRPVPSDAPEDLYFNSSTLDSLVNGPAAAVPDRNGIPRKSWAQIEAENSSLAGDLAAPDGDSRIGTQSPVPGSPARTVHDALYDRPNLLQAGAVADGVNDDTPNFINFENLYKNLRVDLLGKTYLVTSDFKGNLYYNGFLKTPVGTITKELPTSPSPAQGCANRESSASLLFYASSLSGPGGNNIGLQSFAFNEVNRNIYTLQLNGAGSGNQSTVNRFSLDGTISQSSLGFSTPVSSDVGHQGLGVEYLDGVDFRLWTTGYVDSRQAVRYSYADGAPLGDIQLFTLFGSDFAGNTSCTPAISYDQQFLIAQGTRTGDADTTIRVWRLKDLVAGGPGDYSESWLLQWRTLGLVGVNHPTQGLASDGKSIWLIAGNQSTSIPKKLHQYSIFGDLIRADNDFKVGQAQALLDGSGTVYEPECLAVLRTGNGLTLCVGVLSGDLGTRFSRVYALNTIDPVKTKNLQLEGNIRSSLYGFTESGREGLRIRGGVPGATASGFDLYGPGDSTSPSQIGVIAGNVDAPVALISRTGGNFTLSSIAGELRFNAASGTAVRLQENGVTMFAVNASGNRAYNHLAPINNNAYTLGTTALNWADVKAVLGTFSGPVKIGQFTLATLPSAAANSAFTIDVTDATGGPKRCRSDGSVWKILNTTTTVS